jgi:hypothetical protein
MDVPPVMLADSWADEEFGSADLGHARRTRRLVELAHVFGQRPAASLPQAAQDPALLKAAYRLFDHDDDEFTPADMIASHVLATYERLAACDLVFAVNDTTYLDWSAHPATSGLGPLANAKQQGLVLHSTLVVTPERVPLGLLAMQSWARDAATYGQQIAPKERPISEKESHKWLDSLQAANLAHDAAPQTTVVFLADAEADVYDLFVAERRTGVELLVRAGQDRAVDAAEGRLWAAMQTAPIAETVTVQVAARPAKAAAYGEPAQPAQPAREARVQVRYGTQTLKPPRKRQDEQLPNVTVGVVWAVEIGAPAGATPIRWMLLNSLAVTSVAEALERLDWYCCRWGIEVWHKVLKSGCKIETRQLETAERLQRCLALFGVIAWRVLYALMLSRALPEVACTALLEDDEWQALYVRIKRTAVLPATVPSLREAVRWIAQLGGFQGRKRDGAPGVTVLWRGFQELAASVTMYQIMRASLPAGLPATKHVGKP